MPRSRKSKASGRGRREQSGEPKAAESARPVARGVWSGSITFGLVTVPVELFSASHKRSVGLRMLASDGTPLARRYASTANDTELRADEITRGYEFEPEQFVLISDDELDELAPRRSRDIELERFVDRDEIDPAYFVRPFLVLPSGGQTKAYRLLAETMESTKRAAIARFVMRGKAHAIAIFADRGLLRAETLRFGDEVRSAERIGVPASTAASKSDVDEMARAIGRLAREAVDRDELENPDADVLLRRAKAKLAKGQDVVQIAEEATPAEDGEESEEAGGDVIDLFDLIEKRMRETVKRPLKVRKPASAKLRAAKPKERKTARAGAKRGATR